MTKRAASSGVSPSKNKRSKSQHGQFQIDQFFGSSSTGVKSPVKSTSKPQFVQGSSRVVAVGTSSVPEIIDVDTFGDAEEDFPEVPKCIYPPPVSVKIEDKPASTPISIPKMSRNNDAEPVVFSPLEVDVLAYDLQLRSSQSNKAPYLLLTQALVALSQTKSRIAILNILTNLLRTIILQYPSSLLPAIYLLSNSLKPQFIPVELGLGSSIITRSIQQISGLSAAALRKLYNSTGDPGDVAFAAKSNLRTLIPHPPLTIPYVYDSLLKIAQCKGQGAAKEKQKIVEKLLLAASGEEVRYLTRTLCQNLRVGAVKTSILTALARAMVLTPPEGVVGKDDKDETFHVTAAHFAELKSSNAERDELTGICRRAEILMKQVYAKHPSFDQIIPALLEKGFVSFAERVPLTVGIPVLPMLGSPTRSLDEIYRRLGDYPFTAEFKYDGQRAQIHASCGPDKDCNVKIFSRHLEDMTTKYPDVICLVKTMFKDFGVTSFIMDAEIVAIDPASGALKTFQELSNRARKDVHIKDVRVSVCVFAFDLMYLNEEPLLGSTFRDRRSLLRERFSPKRQESGSLEAHFDFVKSCESEEGRTSIEEFLTDAVENRCEGLMIKVKLLDKADVQEDAPAKKSRLKSLPSTYEPDLRTSAWLKLKKDYMEGLGDSLDLIPIGAWHGNGRKAQWWSPILLALWNPQTGKPVAVCKCMSGFTDAFYKSMKLYFDEGTEECSKEPIWDCDFGGYKPSVYFRPHQVWEIRGADITESPVSVAAYGIVSSSRGLSLRFPRFIKVREDKGIEQASTPSYLADMWRNQQGKGKGGQGNDDGDLIDAEGFEQSDFGSEEEDTDV